MTQSERAFWQAFDPVWLATYDANQKRIELIQGAIDDLESGSFEHAISEREEAEQDLAAIWAGHDAEYEAEVRRGEHAPWYSSYTNHDGREPE